MRENIGIQLYAIKNLCEKDLNAVLQNLATIGFNGIEFHSFYENEPEEITKILAKNNLELIAFHIDIFELFKDFDNLLEKYKRVNCKKVVITAGEFSGEDNISTLIENLNKAQKRFENAGIELFYHNHGHEFSNQFSDGNAFESIIKKTDIKIELDTFWVENAGENALDTYKKYIDRIKLVHLKDGANGISCNIGEGECDIKSLYDYSVQKSMEWIILELADDKENTMQDVKVSFENFKKL